MTDFNQAGSPFQGGPSDPQFVPPQSPAPSPLKHFAIYFAIVVLAFFVGVAISIFYIVNRTELSSPSGESSLPESENIEQQEPLSELDLTGALEVEWYGGHTMTPTCVEPIASVIEQSQTSGEEIGWTSCMEYQLGKVVGGEHDGWELLLDVPVQNVEMGGPVEYYVYLLRDAINPDQYIWLTRYLGLRTSSFSRVVTRIDEISFQDYVEWNNFPWLSSPLIARRGDVRIADLEIAEQTRWLQFASSESLTGIAGRVRSVGVGGVSCSDISNPDLYFAAYSIGKLDDGRLLATYQDTALLGTLVSVRADKRLEFFDLEVPFYKIPSEQLGQIDTFIAPSISWNNGTEVAEYSKSPRTGCGSVGVADVVSKFAVGDLRVTGMTSNGDPIYESAEIPENMKWHYESWTYQQAEGADKSLEAYMSLHPYFFWEDALGRMIRFSRVDLVPAAECGKPVIYLYPTKPTSLVVKLNPRGGFSKTEPEYKDGWRVLASPNGTLVNKDDGLSYPYLFWEGRGGMYSSPEKFWSVSRENVEPFLREKLTKLGLNMRETADFIEFWLPKMQDAPYYKIGFHGRAVMDQIAPLSLSSRPDTVIRVLMDYQELDKPVRANPPRIVTPERRGFTVVEWGGVLR